MVQKIHFCSHVFICLFLFPFLLIPGSLFAQQNNSPSASNTPSSALPSLNSRVTTENYFKCLNACPESSPVEAYFKCLNACSYPEITLEKEAHKPIVDETLEKDKEIEDDFEDIIEERLECFAGETSIQLRIRSCRKEYIQDVMVAARKLNRTVRQKRHFKPKRGHRELGKFVTCIQYCPIELAICRGDVALGLHTGTCDNREIQCLQKCFKDHYL